MHLTTHPMHSQRGFSLIQLSVIVLAAGLVAAAVIPSKEGGDTPRRYMQTYERAKAIDQKFKNMMRSQGRRPCPASGEYYPGNARFGFENGSRGDCADSGATDGILTPFDDTNVVAGTVPVHTLGLSTEHYFDGWGRPFTYVVDKRATSSSSCVQTTGGGDVRWYDSDGGTLVGRTMYGLISHGPDGHGAFQPGGSTRADRIDTGSTDAGELNNAGASGAADFDPPTFVNEWVKTGPNFSGEGYDDFAWYNAGQKNKCCIGNACAKAIAALVPPPPPTPTAAVLNGITGGDFSGRAISSGDFNGDGVDDVLIGAYRADPNGGDSGETYIIYG
ncbi:FG-GAP repeat protein, partial [Rhodopirellula europaea]